MHCLWEHTIRDDQDYAVHMDYIHLNRVKHGACGPPTDWPFSSFKRCVVLGFYPLGQALRGADLAKAGERRPHAVVG